MSLSWILASVSAAEVLIGLAVFCLLFLVLQSFQRKTPQGLKKIPGPRGYPLVGNLLDVGKNVHLSLTQLSRTYGDIMMIHLGTKPVLVLSGLETIKEALVRQGEDFKGRPDLYVFRHVSDGQSLAFSTDSGPVWFARRKLTQKALKTFAISPSLTSFSTCLLEDLVSKEANHLMAKLQEVMLAKNRLDPRLYLTVAAANVILAICFGKRYDYEDEELLNIVVNSFSTVSTGLSWSIMYLISYPEIQKKIQEEIDVTIGRERKPRLSDRSLLPYTEAFILEVFRHSTFLPFTLPHWNLWKDPSAFIPERFLTASGKEINMDEREKVQIFGLGKRRCIGEPIARRELFLFLAILLQDLQFSVPDGVTVNMTPVFGLSLRHKRCEHVEVKQRFPKKTG
ncbi:hypothetical protein Chor_014721 [Crotalus horridus]